MESLDDIERRFRLYDALLAMDVIPFTDAISPVTAMLSKLLPEEARRCKRKWRKVWRKLMKREKVRWRHRQWLTSSESHPNKRAMAYRRQRVLLEIVLKSVYVDDDK